MHRRGFVDSLFHAAGQAAGAVADLRDTVANALVEADTSPELALVHVSRRAMATSFELVIPVGVTDGLAAAEHALDVISDLEDQLTVYQRGSEISRLNQTAAAAPVHVEARLYDLLKLAWSISKETNGAFDVTAGALIKTWGFFRRAGRMPTVEERRAALTRTGYRHMYLDHAQRTCCFLCEGLELNLGSIGKGYALDRAAQVLREEWQVPAGLLHGGHSSVYALGSDPRDSRGWQVSIQHPSLTERTVAVVRLRDEGLATTAATFQNLEHNGKKLGHVLDPRIGWPAEKLAQSTVIARTSAEADALSTAFFVMGLEGAQRYCASHPGVAAILLRDEDEEPIVLNAHALSCVSLVSSGS
jgi:FAD:protein FMN transferase